MAGKNSQILSIFTQQMSNLDSWIHLIKPKVWYEKHWDFFLGIDFFFSRKLIDANFFQIEQLNQMYIRPHHRCEYWTLLPIQGE